MSSLQRISLEMATMEQQQRLSTIEKDGKEKSYLDKLAARKLREK